MSLDVFPHSMIDIYLLHFCHVQGMNSEHAEVRSLCVALAGKVTDLGGGPGTKLGTTYLRS